MTCCTAARPTGPPYSPAGGRDYGLTAYACVWYFRHELGRSSRDLIFKGIFPLVGALMLTAVFVQTAIDTLDPAYGSGSSVFGIGSVLVIGVGPAARRCGAHVRVAVQAP